MLIGRADCGKALEPPRKITIHKTLWVIFQSFTHAQKPRIKLQQLFEYRAQHERAKKKFNLLGQILASALGLPGTLPNFSGKKAEKIRKKCIPRR
jgi:hypothetical protein